MHVASSTGAPAHEKRPQGSLAVVNSSTTAAQAGKRTHGSRRAGWTSTVAFSQLSRANTTRRPHVSKLELSLPLNFTVQVREISFQNRCLGNDKYKALGTGTRTSTMQQRETQTPRLQLVTRSGGEYGLDL